MMEIIPMNSITRLGLSILLAASLSTAAQSPTAGFHVVDAEGQPIPHFRARVNVEYQWTHWHDCKDGEGRVPISSLRIDNPGAMVEVVVDAEGYAAAFTQMTAADLQSNRNIVLQRGKLIQLKLTAPEGRPLPESLTPQLFLTRHKKLIRISSQNLKPGQNLFDKLAYPVALESRTTDTFTYRVNEDDNISFMVDEPGYMRMLDIGPYTPEQFDEGPHIVEIPETASVRVRLTSPPGTAVPEYDSYIVNVVSFPKEDGGSGFSLDRFDDVEPGAEVNITGIPPGGDYWVEFMAQPRNLESENLFYRDVHILELQPGELRDIASEFVPYDRDLAKGDHTLRVTAKHADGTPAAGIAYELRHTNYYYGGGLRGEPTAKGTIPDSGVFEIAGLSARNNTPQRVVERTIEKYGEEAAGKNYSLVLGDRLYRGSIAVKPDAPITEIEVVLSPDSGDIAPDIPFVDSTTREARSLSDWRGEVVFLEVWASWCGPCQGPMAHNVELMAEHGQEWENKAVILPLSIDNELETVLKHIHAKGWSTLPHHWTGEPGEGWKSQAAQALGVSGVPTAFLIDQQGIIRWRGHPSQIDIPERINDLLGE